MLTDIELIKINDDDASQPLYPFVRQSIGSPSYGLSSHGYDIRLADEWYISTRIDSIIDPLSPTFKEDVKKSFTYIKSDSYVIKPNEFVLAASYETFNIPDNLSMELKDKSTLARLGIQVFNTISECSWKGILVIEIYNNSNNSIRLSSGMAIAQAVFHKLKTKPMTTYADRKGKYQNQGNSLSRVTLAR